MSAKILELAKSNALDYSIESQSLFGKNKISKKHEFQIGVPRPNLTNEWVTTFTSIPADENPLNIESGVDDIKQTGKVHFLVGQWTLNDDPFDPPVTRNIVVAENQSLIFPIFNSMADNIGWNFSDPSDGITYYRGFQIFPDLEIPYELSIDELRTWLTDKSQATKR